MNDDQNKPRFVPDNPAAPALCRSIHFTLGASSFSVIKHVDQASPAIQLAVASGSPFATHSILLYDTNVPGSQPDATLIFHSVLGSSFHVLSGTGIPSEEDTFAYLTVTPEPLS